MIAGQAHAGSQRSLEQRHRAGSSATSPKSKEEKTMLLNKSNPTVICNLNGISVDTNLGSLLARDPKCEMTGSKKRSTPTYFPSSILSLRFTCPCKTRSISLNEMQRAITHYPINWSRHSTVCAALAQPIIRQGSQWALNSRTALRNPTALDSRHQGRRAGLEESRAAV